MNMHHRSRGDETARLVHLLGLVKDVGEVALAAVLTVLHGSHEDTSTALYTR
jgi:hypothetical protein